MKRMTLIAVALCLMMIATFGVGAVTAKQDENPRQAGKSSVYFYDVAASDTHGKGKLIVDVDKHTFEFNGQGFTPSTLIDLRARAADNTDFAVFATELTTPSGNLHVAGPWEADAAPVEVIAGDYAMGTLYPSIHSFALYNLGAFVAKLSVYYSTDEGVTWHESKYPSPRLWAGQWWNQDLHWYGVPDGALVRIHAIVVAGNDRTGSEVFRYEHWEDTWPWEWNHPYASYKISGTTLRSKLTYCGKEINPDPYGPPLCY